MNWRRWCKIHQVVQPRLEMKSINYLRIVKKSKSLSVVVIKLNWTILNTWYCMKAHKPIHSKSNNHGYSVASYKHIKTHRKNANTTLRASSLTLQVQLTSSHKLMVPLIDKVPCYHVTRKMIFWKMARTSWLLCLLFAIPPGLIVWSVE